MQHKQKVTIFSTLALVSATTTSIIASISSVRIIFIVLPLVFMGIFLFFSGYYAGLARNNK